MANFENLKKMAMAVSMANGNGARNRHVAIILKGNRVLSVGVNSTKTHPMAKKFKLAKSTETQCAELNAALKLGLTHRDALPDFTNLTMVIFRIRRDAQKGFTISKPCIGCKHLINQMGFKKVYYTDHSGELVSYA